MPSLPTFDPVSLLIIMVGLGVLPFLAMVVTSYTKISVVLGLLRNALGVQQVPSNMVISAVAIMVSAFIMAPIAMEASDRVVKGSTNQILPSSAQQLIQAAQIGYEPFRVFLSKHAGAREKEFFMSSARALWPKDRLERLSSEDLIVVAPAFLLTELAAAFRIGFLLYLCFTVVDLVIANVLLAMGLSQVTPTNVAIPFKLLLFVALDGWSRLIHGLVLTYRS